METSNKGPAGPQADRNGVRHYHSQSILDKQGIERLDTWFHAVFPVVTKRTNVDVQLRGIDLSVGLQGVRGAKSVGVDLKADNYTSGNISIELISQDRPNSKRDEAAVGWTGKDMPLVAQMFMLTGEMVFINMTLFYPWLFAQLKDIVEGRATRFKLSKSFLSGTPNATFLTHNIIVPIRVLLAEAPGCLYVRARDVLSEAKYAQLLPPGGFPAELLLADQPYDNEAALSTLKTWLSQLGGYDVKPQLTPFEKERLLRFLEPRVQFSAKRPEVREAGLALLANRPRLQLPEDTQPAVA